MGVPFSDITLYLPTPLTVGTPEYEVQTALENFVSDLYVQKMNGYKPPKTSRVTIQPAYHSIWNRTWKNGSIVSIAPFFSYDKFKDLDTKGKHHYILDLIQSAMLQLSDEYGWDRNVFELAYKEIIANNFKFNINYSTKRCRDKRKLAHLCIRKTEATTSVYVNICANGKSIIKKLFDKKNVWWYDCVYLLAPHGKWLDTDKFGISYKNGLIDIWYSIENDEVALFEKGSRVTVIDFKKFFLFG